MQTSAVTTQTTQTTQTKKVTTAAQKHKKVATQKLLWAAQNATRGLDHLYYLHGGAYTRTIYCKSEVLAIAIALAKAERVANKLEVAKEDYSGTKYLQHEAIYTSVANADAEELELQDCRDAEVLRVLQAGEVIELTSVLLAEYYSAIREAVFCGHTQMWYTVAEYHNFISIATGCKAEYIRELSFCEEDFVELAVATEYFAAGSFAEVARLAKGRKYRAARAEFTLASDAGELAHYLASTAEELAGSIYCNLVQRDCQPLADTFVAYLLRLGGGLLHEHNAILQGGV